DRHAAHLVAAVARDHAGQDGVGRVGRDEGGRRNKRGEKARKHHTFTFHGVSPLPLFIFRRAYPCRRTGIGSPGHALVLFATVGGRRARARRRRGRRHGLEVGRDGGDLLRREVGLEARHARRAVG